MKHLHLYKHSFICIFIHYKSYNFKFHYNMLHHGGSVFLPGLRDNAHWNITEYKIDIEKAIAIARDCNNALVRNSICPCCNEWAACTLKPSSRSFMAMRAIDSNFYYYYFVDCFVMEHLCSGNSPLLLVEIASLPLVC